MKTRKVTPMGRLITREEFYRVLKTNNERIVSALKLHEERIEARLNAAGIGDAALVALLPTVELPDVTPDEPVREHTREEAEADVRRIYDSMPLAADVTPPEAA